MDHPVHVAWEQYLDAEASGLRGRALEALGRFIETFRSLPTDARRTWALGLAQAVADEEATVPIRTPLFRDVLRPILEDGVRQGEAGCARWLAHHDVLLIQCGGSSLPESLRNSIALLKEALRVDSTDALARRRLVEANARYMTHTLHELPAGVLFEGDRATLGQCHELLALLAEFWEHLTVLGLQHEYAELVRECDHHYRAYAEYLRVRAPGDSYEAFASPSGRPTRG